MHDVVPRGFAAYARVFHPAVRERPVGRSWPTEGDATAWEAFLAERPDVDAERVTWAGVAAAFGRVMHPLAQWNRLVGADDPYGGGAPRDAAGWRYEAPQEGRLEPGELVALAQILQPRTTTPDAGGIAVWEGWGGLVGAEIDQTPTGLFTVGMPRRYAEYSESDQTVDARHRSVLYRSLKDVFNNPFRKPVWRTGVLSNDISRGPRLELPHRGHVLFQGGVAEFADPDWVMRVPWRDMTTVGWPDPPSPSIIWPDDHAWAMVTEIDADSTIVAGDIELIEAIVADPRLEAASLPADAALSSDADEVNR